MLSGASERTTYSVSAR